MGLDDYRAKRDFGKTPEPEPAVDGTREGNVFVVHRHEATRLHYDLRLEMEGVLRSWAVPKGFSYDPSDKRLAVRTVDHPIEYEHFEGVIPKGEYGAGTMMIWDRGYYEVVKADSGPEAVRAGELKVILHGRKLRGEWHLVRTGNPPPKEEKQSQWLLFKSRDCYAGTSRDSVLGVGLEAAPRADFPGAIEPMRCGAECAPFSDPAWLFEMQFAGRRVFAEKRGREVALRGLEASLPEVERQLASIAAENALIDGVLVVPDEHQRPSLERLRRRLAGESGESVAFYAFDLLHFDEFDLRGLPLLERKAALRAVLAPAPGVLFVDHVPGNGESLAEVVAAAGLPAAIAKRADAPYTPGPSESWLTLPVGAGPANAEAAGPEAGASVFEALEALERERPERSSARVKFTNLDKVFWPAEGFTKGDLVAHYERVADWILPYLHERPIHMNRFPDGIDGKSFYQRQAKVDAPEWLTKVEIASSGEEPHLQMICNDRDSLLWLANQGSIDIHPWLSRRGSLDSPDWCLIDLDPKGAPFTHVVRVARAVGKVLRGIGLRPYLKTSGKTGLHIVVPLVSGYTYDHSRMFGEGVARVVVRELKDICTIERVIDSRGGKVYIDFLQNRRGQTIVPPYCARPVPGAQVSTPLAWDELESDLTPALFTIQTVPERFERVGELYRDALTDLQDLLPAIEKLQELYLG